MDYYQNWTWCRESNWDGKTFDSRHSVSFGKYVKYEIDDICPDWEAVTTSKMIISPKELEQNHKMNARWKKEKGEFLWKDQESLEEASKRTVPVLRDYVIDWLHANVRHSSDAKMRHQPQGWAFGSEEYRLTDSIRFTIWFLRRRDALNFIKRWSIHKKPTSYYNSFTGDNRELVDGKLVAVDHSRE